MAVWIYSGNVYDSSPAGTTTFPLVSRAGNTIEYLQRSHIKVYSSVDQGYTFTQLATPTDYSLNVAGTEVVLTTGISQGEFIRVQRETPYLDEYVVFQSSSLLTADQLNTAELFSVYVEQELSDRLSTIENLAFKYYGFIDVTTDKAPAIPTNGTFYINTGSGVCRDTWTGIVGDPVVGSEQVVYDATESKWEILETPSSQVGVRAIAGDGPITVDGSTPSVPVIGIVTATPSSKGALSAGDKTKLDSISSGAAVSAIKGTGPITVDESNASEPVVGIQTATQSSKGALSAGDKTKLDSISSGAAVSTVAGAGIITVDNSDPANPVVGADNYVYPDGEQQSLQARLEQYISVLDFIPENKHAAIKNGTSNYDCTANIQDAIDHVATGNLGGTVWIPAGTYKLSSLNTKTVIKNGVTVNNVAGATDDKQAYCLSIPSSNIRLEGEGNSSVLKGSWSYVRSDNTLAADGITAEDLKDDPFAIMISPMTAIPADGEVISKLAFKNLRFSNFSFGIGNLNANVIQSQFTDLYFSTVGVCIYNRHQERNSYDGIHSSSAMALVVAGGMCAVGPDGTDPDAVIDEGGLTDKCTFNNLNLSCLSGVKEYGSYRQFDEWFETYCTRWNLVTAVPSNITNNRPNARYPYQGLCGRALYIMSRYSRPNNSNWIGQISGAKLLRACVQIETANSCNNDGVIYAETIGYTNTPSRDQGPVGDVYEDPYLPRVRTNDPNSSQYYPADSRTPFAVKGVGAVIELQRCYLVSVTNEFNAPLLPRLTQANVTNQQTYLKRESTVINGDLTVDGNLTAAAGIDVEDTQFRMGKGGRFQYTTSVAQPTKTTEISVLGGTNGTCALVLCSRAINSVSSDNVIYMVSFKPTNLSAPTYTKISNTGNDNWVTFGVTTDAVPLITVNGGSKNCRFTFIY